MSRRPRFALALPLLWGASCVLGYRFPGDEFMLWALGSVAGIWVFLLIGDLDPGLPAAACVVLAGALTMAGAGALLDRLRMPWKLWLPAAAAVAILVGELYLRSFPSAQQAVEKHGSLAAYWVFAAQAGSYAATLLGMICVGTWRLLERLGSATPPD